MIDSSLNTATDGHPTISGFKRGASEGGSKSTIEELESKAAKIVDSHLETKEMQEFKKAVEKDPSVLEKAGNNPSIYYKNTCYAFINKLIGRLLKKKTIVVTKEDARIDYLNEYPNTYTEICVDKSKQIHSVEGFRQSPLYFDDYRLDLIKQFQPNYSVDPETLQYIKIIQEESYPVSLHIRRGDYEKIGCCLSMSYYINAIKLMKYKQPDMSLFVFSDNIEWVKLNLDVCGVKTYFISHNHAVNPFDDIWAMSKCKSNIIANSSFSWWGAYLNTNEDKYVIAPRKILDNNNKILPTDWIMIND